MFDEAQVVDVNAKIDDENIHIYIIISWLLKQKKIIQQKNLR